VRKEKLPNFFIVGAAKAGTTSLYYYLKRHPEIFMPTLKEPHFFCYDEFVKSPHFTRFKRPKIGTLREYQALFKKVKDEKAVGEASTQYLFFPSAAYNIRKTIPNPKIIIVLREPFDRAFADYLMDYKRGIDNKTFEEIVFQKLNIKDISLKARYVTTVELGFYYEQVKRYLELFGKDSVKIFLYDDLKADTRGVVKSIFHFLEVSNSAEIDFNVKLNQFKIPKSIVKYFYNNYFVRRFVNRFLPYSLRDMLSSRLFIMEKPEMNKEAEEYLRDLYRKDILRLQQLIGRNLEHWL